MKAAVLTSLVIGAASATMSPSSLRGAVEIVDLASTNAMVQQNVNNPDHTIKSVTVTSSEDTVGVRMHSLDAGAAYSAKMECITGFTGPLCQININDCVDTSTNVALCQHDGTCTDGIASFECACTGTGYTGMHCETPLKCIYGATTSASTGLIKCEKKGTIGGFTPDCTCSCADGYEGDDCATASACTPGSGAVDGTIDCKNGGSVTGFTETCGCDCAATATGYHGDYCEIASACVSERERTVGKPGAISCSSAHGTVGGTTGACTCTCALGWEEFGGRCDKTNYCTSDFSTAVSAPAARLGAGAVPLVPALHVKINYYSAKLTSSASVDTLVELKGTLDTHFASSTKTTASTGAYCTKDLTSMHRHANKNLCDGGAHKNIMQRFSIKFYEPSSAGSDWQFRYNIDATYGAESFVDGISALAVQENVWKRHNVDLETPTAPLAQGPHEFTVYGAEKCCDGEANDWEFKRGDAPWERITKATLDAVASIAPGAAQ